MDRLAVGVVADDVGQQLRPEDVDQRLAPVLEVVGDDLDAPRPCARRPRRIGHRHRRRPAAPVDRLLPVPEAQVRAPPPLGRDDGDVPATGTDLVLDPRQVPGQPLGRLVRAVDEEQDPARLAAGGVVPCPDLTRPPSVGRAVDTRHRAPASICSMPLDSQRQTTTAAILGCAGLLLVGWAGLLVPSLIRSIEPAFGQTDAGIGVYFFVNAVAYVAGSMGGGFLTERIGRRVVLPLAVALIALGLAGLAVGPDLGALPRRGDPVRPRRRRASMAG